MKSNYLYGDGEKTSKIKQVYDLYGNSVQSKDVVWVYESKAPTSSLGVIKAFDEKVNELGQVSSDDPYFADNNYISELPGGIFGNVTEYSDGA